MSVSSSTGGLIHRLPEDLEGVVGGFLDEQSLVRFMAVDHSAHSNETLQKMVNRLRLCWTAEGQGFPCRLIELFRKHNIYLLQLPELQMTDEMFDLSGKPSQIVPNNLTSSIMRFDLSHNMRFDPGHNLVGIVFKVQYTFKNVEEIGVLTVYKRYSPLLDSTWYHSTNSNIDSILLKAGIERGHGVAVAEAVLEKEEIPLTIANRIQQEKYEGQLLTKKPDFRRPMPVVEPEAEPELESPPIVEQERASFFWSIKNFLLGIISFLRNAIYGS